MIEHDQLLRLEAKIDDIREEIIHCRIDIATLKVKAGIWGALAGLVPVVIGLGLWVLGLR